MFDRKESGAQRGNAIDELRRAIAQHQRRRHQVTGLRGAAGVGGLAAEAKSTLDGYRLAGHRIQRATSDAKRIAIDFVECLPRKVMSEDGTAAADGEVPSG